ncbi:MAG: hypothetical protein MP439_02100 [Ferrimicrobium sp.]|jgi:hypothetical protein|nr:hypothetical protein [Ferrimicrobium sp.]
MSDLETMVMEAMSDLQGREAEGDFTLEITNLEDVDMADGGHTIARRYRITYET